MKKVLLAVIGLLVVAAGALAILIYSIDWNEHKAKISEQFSAATGKKVVFAGPVELKFLPSPYLTAQDIKIYSEKAEIPQPLAEVERLVAKLSWGPLLKGEFNVEQMILQHPTVRMKIMDDGSLNWAGELSDEQKRQMEETQVKLDNLSIEKATLTFYDAKRGIDWKFDNLSAEIMADSLLGPFHIEGSYMKDNNPAGFAFSIGRITENMNTSINAVINNPATQTMFRFDGSVMPKNDVVTGNLVFESNRLMNFVTENFKNVQFDKQYDMPLAVSTQINTNKQKIDFSNLIVKYGDTAAAGNIIIPRLPEVTDWNQQAEDTPRQKIEMAFNLTEFDLTPVVSALNNLFNDYDQGKELKINPKADIMADVKAVKAKYAGQEIKNLELSLDVVPGKIQLNKLQAQLPGNASLSLKGSIFPDEKGLLMYKSDMALQADELVDLLRAIKFEPPLPVPSIYRKFTGTAKAEGSLKEIKITPIDFTLDKTKVAGDIALMREDGKLKLFVIGEADSINFDNYVPMLPEEVLNTSLENRLHYRFAQLKSLQNLDVQFMLKLGLGIYDNLPFEKLLTEGKLQNGVMELKKLEIPSLSGGSLEASGKIKGFGENFEFENLKYKFQNPDFFSLLNKFSVQLPDWEIKNLKNFTAEGIATGTLKRFALKNVSKLENIDMSFGGEVTQTEHGDEYVGKLYLKAPDFITMLQNFKVNYAPNVYSLGVLTLNADVSGMLDNFKAENLVATIGQNKFEGNLSYAKNGDKKTISGSLNANQFELERFFYNGEANRVNNEIASFKKPDADAVAFLPKPLWSTMKINYDLYKNINLDLTLAFDKLTYENLVMQNVMSKLNLLDANLKITDFSADYNKGKIQAGAELNFAINPTLKGTTVFLDVNLDDTFWSGNVYGFNYGVISSNNTFAADASSLEDIIKTLELDSDFEIKNAEFKGISFVPIADDLKKRVDGEGLSKLVRENLEKGKTIFQSISGTLKVAKADYSFSNMKFVTDNEAELNMAASGNLLLWDTKAQFELGFKNIKLPKIGFVFQGPLSAPQLEVNVEKIVNLYQRQHAEIAAKKQAEAQAERELLQKSMNEQMSIAKSMETRLNQEIRQKFQAVKMQIQNPQTAAAMETLNEELNNIGKGLAEVLTLGLSPKFEQTQIDDAKRKNALLQNRIDKAEAEIIKHNVDDIKYRANLLYNQIADIHVDAQRKLNDFKVKIGEFRTRLANISTDYVMDNDANATALNALVESLFVDLDDINSALSRDYVQMQNTLDPLQLSDYEDKIKASLVNAKLNIKKLANNITKFYAYVEPQVKNAEKLYQEKLRQAEIERKLKENTGTISVAGGGKSMTVVRDIEDIEKSESLQEQNKIPVLDFSSHGNENVVIKQGAKPKVLQTKKQNNILIKSEGKISQASGVIVRK